MSGSLTPKLQLTPQMLKAAVTSALVTLMAPIQEEFQASAEWQDIEKKAYPPPPTEQKKKKPPKDRGSRYPGAPAAKKAVEAQPDGSVQGDQKEQVSLGADADAAMKQLDLGRE